ncbi:MAG: ABC transporter substrate-binding protein, partial [Acidobacteriota bacterium]|nr:ABC transporter substrate-binding protein [Acidobacteriota bacterium]
IRQSYRMWSGKFPGYSVTSLMAMLTEQTTRRIAILLTAACLLHAQQAPRAGAHVPRGGILTDLTSTDPNARVFLSSFQQGLRDLGYTDGKNAQIETRAADRNPDRLAAMAAELTRSVDVLVTSSSNASKAAHEATSTVPIVGWGAPVNMTGNMTGFTGVAEHQKEFLLQLKEIVPGLKRVALLFDRSYYPVLALLQATDEGARSLGLDVIHAEVHGAKELPSAFAAMERDAAQAVLVLNHPLFRREPETLAALAIEHRLPLSSPYRETGAAGALIAHEQDFGWIGKHVASYVDKVLKGARPGDLPVDNSAPFLLFINMHTARAIGVNVPETLLSRAAEVFGRKSASTAQPIRIGILMGPLPGAPAVLASFKGAMTRLGYIEGRNVVYEERLRDVVGTMGVASLSEMVGAQASQLVQAGVRVLVASGSTEALLSMKASSAIPIVFWSADPVAEGLAKSLQQPGANATGFTSVSSGVREQLETLRKLIPSATHITILNNPSYLPGRGVLARTQRASESLGLRVDVIEVSTPGDLPDAFAKAERSGSHAVVLTNHGMFRSAAAAVAQLAIEHHLPLFSPYDELAQAGALLGWVPSFIRWSELAAEYVDRILKGATPATLPVEQSVPFLYTVNLRTAQKLHIAIPEDVLGSVERVIK